MLIVNGNAAYNADFLVEMTVDDEDNMWDFFHIGSEHGFYDRRIYSGIRVIKAFNRIVSEFSGGDKVCRLDEE